MNFYGPQVSPFPSFVFALRSGGAGGGCGSGGGGGAGVATGPSATMLSTAAATLAAARAAVAVAEPRRGLLVLNSRHLAPSTIIILDTAILGFFAAMRGLWEEVAYMSSQERRDSNKMKPISETQKIAWGITLGSIKLNSLELTTPNDCRERQSLTNLTNWLKAL